MVCQVPLPEPGEPKRAILETYPKEHSAGYHGQALIDLAFRMRSKIQDVEAVEEIVLHSKRLTHLVMGSGAGAHEKHDPTATPAGPRRGNKGDRTCSFSSVTYS